MNAVLLSWKEKNWVGHLDTLCGEAVMMMMRVDVLDFAVEVAEN